MPKPDHAPGYVPNDACTQEDWDEVCDNPELTDAEIAELRPAAEVLPPAIYAALVSKGGRPKAEVRRVPISLRVAPDVLAAFKAGGPGWQTRMNEALASAAAGMREAGAVETSRTVAQRRLARRAVKSEG